MAINSSLSHLNIEYYAGDYSDFIPGDEKYYPKDTIYDAANKIYFVISGKHGFIIDPDGENKTVTVSSGQMIFIHSGMPHKFFVQAGETFEMYWIRFSFNVSENNFFDLFDFNMVANVKDINNTISMMRSIIMNTRKEDLQSQFKSKAEIINLSLEYLRLAKATPKSLESKSITIIAQYIDANLNLNFSLEMLAEMAHLHPHHFIRKFKAEFGITPMKYITNKRMDHALGCLENTTMSIQAIMASCGYSDMSHFSKTFKKYKGTSPSYFRSLYGKSPKIRTTGNIPPHPSEEYTYHKNKLSKNEKASGLVIK